MGPGGPQGFEGSLAEAMKRLVEDEPSRLDFYEDFDAFVPPAGEMYGRLSGAADEGRSRGRRRKHMWIASSSLAAAVAIVLLVTTVYSPGAFTGGAWQSAADVDVAESAVAPDEPTAGSDGSSSTGAGGALAAGGWGSKGEVVPAALPARQLSYGDIYDALSSTPEYRSDMVLSRDGSGSQADQKAQAAIDDITSVEDAAPAEAAAPEAASAPSAEAGAPADNSVAAEAAAPADNAAIPEFSGTNVQTEGVQEADIVKTDGRYIYTANSESICITDANEGDPEVLSEIPQPQDGSQVYFKMYIEGDTLILLRQGYGDLKGKDGEPSPSMEGGIRYPDDRLAIDTSVDIYDVADRENPRRKGSLSQSGYYADSRMIDGKLYLISTYHDFDFAKIDKDDPRTYVPLFEEGGRQLTSEPGDVRVPGKLTDMNYTVVSGIDTDAAVFVSHESLLGGSYTVYASHDNLYLSAVGSEREQKEEYGYRISQARDRTLVTRLSMKEGRVKAEASAYVPGTADDQFSLDEYDGALRIVTTKSENVYAEPLSPPAPSDSGSGTGYFEEYYAGGFAANSYGAKLERIKNIEKKYGNLEWSGSGYGYKVEIATGLYVLGMDMKPLGKVEDLAPSEHVYSCRYMGDVAYFVTFRNTGPLFTDPLFSVDLSDPARPKVMGKLKIPGFSEYLHPYSEGLLFGLGADADEETGEVKGLKVSMFDYSDPYDVAEKDKLILYGLSYTYAETGHKAVLVDERKSIVAFPAYDKYVILNYDKDKGFSRVMDVTLEPPDYADDEWSGSWYLGLRGIFIGDVFYVIAPDSIHAYDMKDGFKALGSVSLGSGAKYVDSGSFSLPPGYGYGDIYGDIPIEAFPETK
jgi:uncharacterized secreted protein with C-terminal beta-propeller domain